MVIEAQGASLSGFLTDDDDAEALRAISILEKIINEAVRDGGSN